MKRVSFWLLLVLCVVPGGYSLAQSGTAASTIDPSSGALPTQLLPRQGQFVNVRGLRIFYEVHGQGKPLVLLHGSFGWGIAYPELQPNRKLITLDFQAHGRTADIDRPLTFAGLADDVAELLKFLGIKRADFFGYSTGGNVGLALAIRHPQLVDRLAINGSHFGRLQEAYHPEVFQQIQQLPAEFSPAEFRTHYDRVAPRPQDWPRLVAKAKAMELEFEGFDRQALKQISCPVLITLGDRDGVRVEHAVELYRLLPNSRLAILPNGDHFQLMNSPEQLLPLVASFLNEPNLDPAQPK